MINVTDLVKYVAGFDPDDFIDHLYEEALTAAGATQTAQGWWSSKKQYLAATAKDAVRRAGLTHEQVKATSYYALTEAEVSAGVEGGVVLELHGVSIWGTVDVE